MINPFDASTAVILNAYLSSRANQAVLSARLSTSWNRRCRSWVDGYQENDGHQEAYFVHVYSLLR